MLVQRTELRMKLHAQFPHQRRRTLDVTVIKGHAMRRPEAVVKLPT